MEIILALKHSQGMAVGDLAKRLGMSYMGIKQHCVLLEKKGYLDTWRQPQEVGRPLKLYRLTEKALPLFPTISDNLVGDLLQSVGQAYGSSAPEKLLHGFFQRQTDAYRDQVVGERVAERAASLASLRSEEGYLSNYMEDEEGAMLEERHSLLASLESQFPIVARLEEQMISTVIGAGVARSVERSSGLSRYLFKIRSS